MAVTHPFYPPRNGPPHLPPFAASAHRLLPLPPLQVLDEAHHCHDDHPYAQAMRHFRPHHPPPVGGRGGGGGDGGPRVLGATASPASEQSLVRACGTGGAGVRRLGVQAHRERCRVQ